MRHAKSLAPRLVRRPTPLASAAAVALVAACLVPCGGCVERKLVIRTQPEGAALRLDGVDIPTPTPVELPATFDGVHHVEIVANGYRAVTTTAEVPARWHDWFPLDFVAEFLWPGTIRETLAYDFKLEPYAPLTPKAPEGPMQAARDAMADLKTRAEEYRAAGVAGPGAVVADGGSGKGSGAGAGVPSPDFAPSSPVEMPSPASKSREDGLRPIPVPQKPAKPGVPGK